MKKIAIDLGGTNIRCAVLNEQYEIECLEKERTVHTGSLEDNIKQIVKLIQNCSCIKDEKTTIGIGVPGVVNEEGILKYISNIPELEGINLTSVLKQKIKVPVTVVNDANAAAIAEAKIGAGRNFKSVYYITVSTGIGGGFVLNGDIVKGASGYAGEAGSILIRKENKDSFGSKLFPGSIECYASGNAITRRGSSVTGKSLKDAGEVFKAAKNGELWGIALVDQMAYDLAMMCADISYIVNPQIFVFGGGCMTIDNPFFDKMCKNYYEIVDEGLHNIIFKRAALSEAGIIGAAICAEGEIKNGN